MKLYYATNVESIYAVQIPTDIPGNQADSSFTLINQALK